MGELIVKRGSEGFDKELISEGTIQMVITGLFDLGIQEVKKYQSEETEHQRQIMVVFEVDEVLENGEYAGQRKRYYQKYKLSMHKKAKLFGLVKALAGASKAEELAEKGFDMNKMVGMNCYGTFEHRIGANNDFAVLINTSQLPKGIEKLVAEKLFTDDDNAPDWIKTLKAKAIDADVVQEVKAKVETKKAETKVTAKVTKKAEELFPDEEVTSEEPDIDPWD